MSKHHIDCRKINNFVQKYLQAYLKNIMVTKISSNLWSNELVSLADTRFSGLHNTQPQPTLAAAYKRGSEIGGLTG